jgi:hypothetical protein
LAERQSSPLVRFMAVIMTITLGLGTVEAAMRYLNWPRPVISGWRASEPGGPLNQFGWRGQPARRHQPGEFLVVMTGASAVECLRCPPDETLDVMLERALHRYNPDARVITLGSAGYGQDQEYLALHDYFALSRADLVIAWTSIADDVTANTFRSVPMRSGQTALKPSFALLGKDLIGPTELIGQPVYSSKLSTLIRPWFIDIDRNWTILLPAADPGSPTPPAGTTAQSHVSDRLEQQRSAWSIWLTPRPDRVEYGLELTHTLLSHMREVATLRGARFTLLLTPATSGSPTAPLALEHDGHWFLADPAARDAAIAKVTDGFDTLILPSDGGLPASPDAERRMMKRLADALSQHDLLTPLALTGARH